MLFVPIVAAIVLAGEPVSFATPQSPVFSDRQVQQTADATRAGLARWCATAEGRKIIAYLAENNIVVTVVESAGEEGIGRAPDPKLQSLVAASRHERLRSFEVILNPQYFRIPAGWTPLPNEPSTPADAMAAAWAGEMLHVYFYAQGIELPHHARSDFQDEWREVAAELGMPNLEHGDDTLVRSRGFGGSNFRLRRSQ